MRKRMFKKRRVLRAKSFRRYARRVIRAGQETKRHDTFYQGTFTSSGLHATYPMTELTLGDTRSQREGNQVMLSKDIIINTVISYPIHSAEDSNNATFSAARRSNFTEIYIIRDMRPHEITGLGAYVNQSPPDADMIFNYHNGQRFYKSPRDTRLQVVAIKRIMWDKDDDRYKAQERRFRWRIKAKNQVLKWWGSDPDNLSTGHYWIITTGPHRTLLDGQTTPAPLTMAYRHDWSFAYTEI